MQIEFDVRGNQYIDVENVRFTYVRATDRDPAAEWSGTDVVRMQAYTGAGRSLHRGAELMLPANRPEAMLAVIEALCKLWAVAHVAPAEVADAAAKGVGR